MGRRLEYEVKTSVRLNMSNPQPVSYTHLDVYKRQAKSTAKSSTDAALEAMHTRMYASFGGGHIEYLYQSS